MDCVTSFIQSPLEDIQRELSTNSSYLENLDLFGLNVKEKLQNYMNKIPSINDTNMDNIKPNSLVKFRGMVQDMFDPEFYLGKFETINKKESKTLYNFGCYTDTGNLQDNEEINFECETNVTLEQQTYYCVPIPGENDWLKGKCMKQSLNVQCPGHFPNYKKRQLDDEEKEERMELQIDPRIAIDDQNGIRSPEKKIKENNSNESNNNIKLNADKGKEKTDFTKNFPLPDEKGIPCFVTLYSNFQDLKLNDVAEFICILSVDPQFGCKAKSQDSMQYNLNGFDSLNSIEEEAHCPPPSLVPRLHCIFFNKLKDSIFGTLDEQCYEKTTKELSSIRADLIHLLTKFFGGDTIAAEYLLLHLISKIYGRYGTMCNGKMSLNITNCPNEVFTTALYQLIELLVEKSYFLPLSLENLNKQKFVPRKDYEANRLVSGILQLSEGTNLVLDETQMKPGQLDSNGVRNLSSIGNIIQWQKLEYNFKFNKVEMDTNINVLVLSEAKSILTCDCRVPIQSDEVKRTDYNSIFSEISSQLPDRMRMYFSVVRNMEYNLTEEIQNALEDDFVEMRKKDAKSTNADSFYLLLTTARYMALSYGQKTLSASLWTRVKELDNERKRRLGI